VARRAGVSLATVSRIASGHVNVAPEVERRVRQLARELGVQLAPKQSNNIAAFLLGNRDVLHPIHGRILSGAESRFRSEDWELLFVSAQYGADADAKELRPPQVLQRRNLVRVAVLAGLHHPNLLAWMAERRLPFVVYGNNVTGEWTPERHDAVFVDDTGGARELTAYLISLGHRRICHVGNDALPWFRRTQQGYEMAMKSAGLVPRPMAGEQAEEREVGYLAAKSLLAGSARPTAILAGSDAVAEGALRAIRDCGLRVPEDISVAGINDTEAGLLHPALTSVQCFPEQAGRRLAELALRRVREPGCPPQQITIPARVVKRESCAAHHRANK